MSQTETHKAQFIDEAETLRQEILALSADSPVDRDRLLMGFARIGQMLMASLDLDDVLDALVELIPIAGGFRSLSISLVNDELQQIEVVRGYMVKEKQIARQDSGNDVGMRYQVKDLGKIIPLTVHTGNLQVVKSADDPRLDSLDDDAKARWHDKVAYFIPVKHQEKVVAVLATGSTLAAQDETLRRIGFMQPLLDQVALALNHALLDRETQKRSQRQASLLNISRTVQTMQRANDLERVIRVIHDELQNSGVGFTGMTIRRFVDPVTALTQRFSILPSGELRYLIGEQPEAYASWKKGEVLYRPDIEHDLQGLPEGYFETTYRTQGYSVRSLLTVSYPQGTFVLRSERAYAYSDGDIKFVKQIVEVLSIAVNRVSDLERLENQNRLLMAMQDIGRAVLEKVSFNDILDHLSAQVIQAGIFRSLMVALVDEEAGYVEVVRSQFKHAFTGEIVPSGKSDVGMRYALDDEGVVSQVARNGQVTVIDDVNDARLDQRFTEPHTWTNKVAYFFPIKHEDRILAVLATGSKREVKDDILRRIEMMQPLLNLVAIALDQARLRQDMHAQIMRQNALLATNASIQKMERTDDLESVIRIIYDQLKYCDVDFAGMSIRRFLDGETGLTQEFGIAPTGELKHYFDQKPEIYTRWKRGEVLYRPDVEHNPQGLDDGYFEKTYSGYGISVRSLLTVSYNQGTLVLRSEHAHAFSKEDMEFVRQIVEMLALAMTRVSDMERLEDQNQTLQENEQRLTEQFMELESVYRFTPVGLFMLDGRGQLLRFNQWLADLYGLEDSDLGRSLYDLVSDSMADLKHAFEQVVKTGEPVMNVEVSGISQLARETENTWLFSYYPLKSTDGHIDRILGAVLDVTAQKQMEQERVRTQRLRALGEMAAGVSHNLNNILTGVIGPAQLAQTMVSDGEAQIELESIITSGLRAKELVSRLSRGLIGEREALRSVDLNAVVEDAVLASRPRWKDEKEASGVAISVTTDLSDVPSVQGTQTGLHDILLNLIFNAVDAMPNGGRVDIQTQLTSEGVQLTVCDTGVGMDARTAARVFDPFFTTKANVGSGLGLSTVYGTVNRWGGHISVESALGEGTTFTLVFLSGNIEDPI